MTPLPQPAADDVAAASNAEPRSRPTAWEIRDADMIWSAYAIGGLWERFPTMTAIGFTEDSRRLRIGLDDPSSPQGIRPFAHGAALARMGQWSSEHIWEMALADEAIQEWAGDKRFSPIRENMLGLYGGSAWFIDRTAGSRTDLGASPRQTHARDILRAIGMDDLWARAEAAELAASVSPARPAKPRRV